MSDSWYRAAVELPPYMDGFGRAWHPFSGEQIGGEVPASVFPGWAAGIESEVLQAEIMFDLMDTWRAAIAKAIGF